MVSSRVITFLCLALADAARVATHSQHNTETDQRHPFSRRSCENLHSRFLVRSNSLQVFVNSYTDSDEMSVMAQARAMMKASAVLRTLRRSSDCPWVASGNRDDIEAVGKVVRKTLASNPCAPAALAELQLLDTDGGEGAAPLGRAMAVLMSDTCEVEHQGQASNELVDDDDDAEELVQDRIEEMLESEDAGSSFVQQADMQRAHSWSHLGQLISVVMLGVLFMLGCGYAGFFLGLVVGVFFGLLLLDLLPGSHNEQWQLLVWGGAFGALAGTAGGAATCGASFYLAVNASGLLLD